MRPVDADEIIKKQRDLVRRICDEIYASDWQHPIILAMLNMTEIVLDAPTIDSVKSGHWIKKQRIINGKRIETCVENGVKYNIEHKLGYYTELYCSECSAVYSDSWNNFCSRCGAKMDGGDNK